MRIALIDTNPKPAVYPVALLKIGAWRKAQGDECKLFANTLPKAGEFDAIWLSTTFTYDMRHSLGMALEAKKRAKDVRVGGVAATLLPMAFQKHDVNVHAGLIHEAEECAPDYSLLPKEPKYSITHTSRGCVRRCDFCMVTKLEPEFRDRPEWAQDIHPTAKRILFYDNNWLAKPVAALQRDAAQIKSLKEGGQIKSIDFNQGLDARIYKGKRAEAMKGLPFECVRFAFDGMHEDGYFQDAVKLAHSHGYNTIRTYVLYNFRDTPADFYYRLRECARLSHELKMSVNAFPMRYQPIMEADIGRKHVGKHWSPTMKKGVASFISSVSCNAIIAFNGIADKGMSGLDEFEYWFGKTEKEFIRLLNYPRLRDLMKRKTLDIRMMRAPGMIKRRAKTKPKAK